jgi:hypothetical protein
MGGSPATPPPGRFGRVATLNPASRPGAMSASRFHHARALSEVVFGSVEPVRLSELLIERTAPPPGDVIFNDQWHLATQLEAAYRWLAERIGFWPIFLAVGETAEDRRLTGYQSQFSRRRGWDSFGQPRDQVLFSYTDAPAEVRFVDYINWHLVLNAVHSRDGDPHQPYVELDNSRHQASILRRSWRQSDWLRHARRHPGSVQAMLPQLDLRAADQIWTPNRPVATALHRLGFDPARISVRRLPCNPITANDDPGHDTVAGTAPCHPGAVSA